ELSAVAVDVRAGAHEVLVAVGVVDAPDAGPELVLPEPGRGERGLLARVGVLPLAGRHFRQRVRRVLERVVLLVALARLDRADLLADRLEGSDEAVELLLRLALGRLDHQGPDDREAHRRRVEA